MYDEWLTDRSREARELNSVNSAWSANAVLRIASRRLEFTTSTCNVKLLAARAQHAGQSLITFEMPDASQVLLPLAARSFTIHN